MLRSACFNTHTHNYRNKLNICLPVGQLAISTPKMPFLIFVVNFLASVLNSPYPLWPRMSQDHTCPHSCLAIRLPCFSSGFTQVPGMLPCLILAPPSMSLTFPLLVIGGLTVYHALFFPSGLDLLPTGAQRCYLLCSLSAQTADRTDVCATHFLCLITLPRSQHTFVTSVSSGWGCCLRQYSFFFNRLRLLQKHWHLKFRSCIFTIVVIYIHC